MSRSLDYCVAAAKDQTRSVFFDRPWENAEEVDASAILQKYLGDNRSLLVSGTDDDGCPCDLSVSINLNPDADFAWFASQSYTHDGSLMAMLCCIEDLIQRICSGDTHHRDNLPPRSGDAITYTMGNFIVLHEHGDFGTPEKPWLKSRVTCLVPLSESIARHVDKTSV